jgi:hypothetical protein
MVDDIDGDEEGIVDVVLDDNAIRQVSKCQVGYEVSNSWVNC